MEGYRVPPVMFTENEANALVTAEQLVLKNKDSSLVKEYAAAINKIKAVLQYSTKEKVELLSNRIGISPSVGVTGASNSVTFIQNALTTFKVLHIIYLSKKDEKTERDVEPFAMYYSLEESWTLIAYCRLRKDFRMFRLDRMLKITQLELSFKPHKLTLEEYLSMKRNEFKHP
jgi:predicted DNA-binding transcriptional regulator YafY